MKTYILYRSPTGRLAQPSSRNAPLTLNPAPLRLAAHPCNSRAIKMNAFQNAYCHQGPTSSFPIGGRIARICVASVRSARATLLVASPRPLSRLMAGKKPIDWEAELSKANSPAKPAIEYTTDPVHLLLVSSASGPFGWHMKDKKVNVKTKEALAKWRSPTDGYTFMHGSRTMPCGPTCFTLPTQVSAACVTSLRAKTLASSGTTKNSWLPFNSSKITRTAKSSPKKRRALSMTSTSHFPKTRVLTPHLATSVAGHSKTNAAFP